MIGFIFEVLGAILSSDGGKQVVKSLNDPKVQQNLAKSAKDITKALSDPKVQKAIAATAATGVAGGAAYAAKTVHDSRVEDTRKHAHKEGYQQGTIDTEKRFRDILMSLARRDQFAISVVKLGLYVSRLDGTVADSEISFVRNYVGRIADNATVPPSIRYRIKQLIDSEGKYITYDDVYAELREVVDALPYSDAMEIKKLLTSYVEELIFVDKVCDSGEIAFLNKFKSDFPVQP